MVDQDRAPSTVMLSHLQKLMKHGIMAAAELEACQVPKDPTFPMPVEGYVVSITTFYERGFTMPPHQFLELHHLNPSVLHIAAFVTLCGAYLGINPDLDLWKYIFHIRRLQDPEAKLTMFIDALLIGPRLLCICVFLHAFLLTLWQWHWRRWRLSSSKNCSSHKRWRSHNGRRPSSRKKRRRGFPRKPLPRSALTSMRSGPRPRLLRMSTSTRWWLIPPVLSTPSGSARYWGRRRLISMGGSGTCVMSCP
jgi:hypothetical protein